MAAIRTPCPCCTVEVSLDVGIVAILPGVGTAVAHYAFVCPACDEPAIKRADLRTASLLEFAGASAAGPPEPAIGQTDHHG